MSRKLTAEEKLYKKLFEIRKEAEAIAKEGHGEGFDYVRFEDVLEEASRLMDEQKVIVVSEVVAEGVQLTGNGAIAKVAMEFEVVDLSSGGSIKRRWSGSADDKPGGKALFKAQTGCEKYFLAKLLRIPFGTDPEEKDKQSPVAEAGASSEAQRVRNEQDRAATAPQVEPRHSRPLPKSDLPEHDWENLAHEGAVEPAHV